MEKQKTAGFNGEYWFFATHPEQQKPFDDAKEEARLKGALFLQSFQNVGTNVSQR